MPRNYNQEFHSSPDRLYAYEFDYLMHGYILRTFQRHIKPGLKMLELGCFEGEFTRRLNKYTNDLTVVEAASDLVSIASTKVSPHVNFICNRFEDLLMNDKFDAIFLIHTLEHLDTPTVVLDKINSWLAPEGLAFIVVPNANAASRQIAVNMGLIEHNQAVTEGEKAHGHRKTYSLDTLFHELKKSDLFVNDSGGIMFKPFANFQFDKLLKNKIIDEAYLEGCYHLGQRYPDLCASIYAVCSRGQTAPSPHINAS